MVDVVFLGSNLFWVYRYNRLVLPTPSSKDADEQPAGDLQGELQSDG